MSKKTRSGPVSTRRVPFDPKVKDPRRPCDGLHADTHVGETRLEYSDRRFHRSREMMLVFGHIHRHPRDVRQPIGVDGAR